MSVLWLSCGFTSITIIICPASRNLSAVKTYLHGSGASVILSDVPVDPVDDRAFSDRQRRQGVMGMMLYKSSDI